MAPRPPPVVGRTPPRPAPDPGRATIEITNRRARAAMAAVAVACVADVVADLWGTYGPLQSVVRTVPQVVAIVLYCRWLYRAYEDNRRLAGARLTLRPGQAVGSFFIPIINLYRPYQALRDLYRASDPRTLPEVPQYRVASSERGYRSNALEVVPPSKWSMWCPLGLWWLLHGVMPTALWLAKLISLRSLVVPVAVTDLLLVVSGVLAIQVIRAIQARQNERLRRLECPQEEPRADAVSVPARRAPLEAPSEPAADEDIAADVDVARGGEKVRTLR